MATTTGVTSLRHTHRHRPHDTALAPINHGLDARGQERRPLCGTDPGALRVVDQQMPVQATQPMGGLASSKKGRVSLRGPSAKTHRPPFGAVVPTPLG